MADEKMIRELIQATKEMEELKAAAAAERRINSLRGRQPAEDSIGKMPYRNDSRPRGQHIKDMPAEIDPKPYKGQYIKKL